MIALLIILSLSALFFTSLINLTPLLENFFPIDRVEAVLFTINQNMDGSNEIVSFFLKKLFLESAYYFALVTVGVSAISFAIAKQKRLPLKQTIIKTGIICNILLFTSFIYVALNTFPLGRYLKLWRENMKEPEHSFLYTNEYIPYSKISFKEGKKNLVVIFLESIESNFQDKKNGGDLDTNRIPEITQWIKENDSFSPGGKPIFGTGWTIASTVAKTCGIPLNFPSGVFHSVSGIKNFLPGATCLSDILNDQGYNVLFAQGSKSDFASMNAFAETHGKSDLHDYDYYVNSGRFSSENRVNWGINDRTLFELAKDDLDSLSKKSKPFAMFLSTIDAHMPYGYMDPQCSHPNQSPKEQYPYVLQCNSKLLDEFLKWSTKQPWFDNTIIAVMGDHETYVPAEAVGFKNSEITHHWLNFFVNSKASSKKEKRDFTSFDMYPTILEAMGAEITTHALGLGRSLYSDEPTLLEKYGSDSLNNLLKGRSKEYDFFLYGKKSK